MEYDLIQEFDLGEFTKRVNEHLKKGWALHGPTQVIEVNNTTWSMGHKEIESSIEYFQAVKKDPFESYVTKEMKKLYEDLKPKEAE